MKRRLWNRLVRAPRWPMILGLGAEGVGRAAAATTALERAGGDAPPDRSLLAQLLDWLARLTGGWAEERLGAGITWGQLLLSVLALLAVACVAQVLRSVMRHLVRSQGGGAQQRPADPGRRTPWLALTLEASIPPLTLYVWLWGVYAVLGLLSAPLESWRSWPLFAGSLSWMKWVGDVAALFWFIFRMIHVIELELRRWSARTKNKWDDVLVVLLARALRYLVPLTGAILVVPTLQLPGPFEQLFKDATSLGLIGAVGFILSQLANAVEGAVLDRFRIDEKDNLEARKINTQVKVLKKIALFIIVLFTAASMLMVFEPVRQLGTSILASAGVFGIIVGFAAQRSIATVLAGFQIALTQPIRLDDVVIVENEWGRIEEITLTYVVVLIWDRRRLVLPISYFIEKPFQNWTRVSAELLGTVFLYLDYTVPLQVLRDELDRLLERAPLWDRKVKGIQVTDTRPDCMEVRVLVSAADASAAWDLRCELREQLVDFLQSHYPSSLPRQRRESVVVAPMRGGGRPA